MTPQRARHAAERNLQRGHDDEGERRRLHGRPRHEGRRLGAVEGRVPAHHRRRPRKTRLKSSLNPRENKWLHKISWFQ